MRFLLDTCVLSELVRPRPDAGVVEWVESQDEESLCISVLTLGELHKGVAKLPDSRKRRRLARWLETDLRKRFEGRVLTVNAEVAVKWGEIQGRAEAGGETLPVVDSLLAATALTHDLSIVTRNTSDIERSSAQVLNPWRL